MTHRHAQKAAMAFAAMLFLVTAWRLRQPAIESTSGIPAQAPPMKALDEEPGDDSLAIVAADIVANDPFRLGNEPASVPYAPSPIGGPDAMRPIVRPALTVKAVMGGPPWQAIVEGVPGVGTAVVRAGSVVGGLNIRSVRRDTVIIAGWDTTWTLVLRQ